MTCSSLNTIGGSQITTGRECRTNPSHATHFLLVVGPKWWRRLSPWPNSSLSLEVFSEPLADLASTLACVWYQSLSRVQLLATPVDCSPPGSSVHGISQARILGWVAISYTGDLPNPAIELGTPYCRWILHCRSLQGSPILAWKNSIFNTNASVHSPTLADLKKHTASSSSRLCPWGDDSSPPKCLPEAQCCRKKGLLAPGKTHHGLLAPFSQGTYFRKLTGVGPFSVPLRQTPMYMCLLQPRSVFLRDVEASPSKPKHEKRQNPCLRGSAGGWEPNFSNSLRTTACEQRPAHSVGQLQQLSFSKPRV